MYYRVAVQVDPSPTWQWKSTPLSELSALFQFLRLHAAFPQSRLRVFSSSSREALSEQLVRENQGFRTTSVTEAQFLHERMICSRERAGEPAARWTRGNELTMSIAVAAQPSPHMSERKVNTLNGPGFSPLDRRREELEQGVVGDHDCPYRFTLPVLTTQVLAWVKLLVSVQDGTLQP